jgi:hypothetical protein
MKNPYPIWTWRAVLGWALPVLTIVGLSIYASVFLKLESHMYVVNGLAIATVALAVTMRVLRDKGIRDSVTGYLEECTRVVVRTKQPWGQEQYDALDDGLDYAFDRCADEFPGKEESMYVAVADAFIVIQDEVTYKGQKFGGLTYPNGTMVLRYNPDLYLLTDLACHEAVHCCLNSLGISDTNNSHHLTYPHLFAPVPK